FRKKKAAAQDDVPLEQSSYDIAYFILPQYVFSQLDRLIDQCLNTPTAAGPFFYVMARQVRETEPDIEAAKQFKWHNGAFDETQKYLLLEYPVPPAVDLGDADPISMLESGNKIVLAPHFSLILYGGDESPLYYILGQSPLSGGTTLRQILDGGMNCNLGPGPPPARDQFFACVREVVNQSEDETG
ncbi:MAG: hypothetical protein AAF497_29505, partial [Planctomycetota bacterium]